MRFDVKNRFKPGDVVVRKREYQNGTWRQCHPRDYYGHFVVREAYPCGEICFSNPNDFWMDTFFDLVEKSKPLNKSDYL